MVWMNLLYKVYNVQLVEVPELWNLLPPPHHVILKLEKVLVQVWLALSVSN